MDTDWCIVCDTRISPELGYLSEITAVSTTQPTLEPDENCVMQASSWAFCSTDCFLKASDDAHSKNITGIQQPSIKITSINFSHRHNPSSFKPLHHPSRKDPSKLLISSYDSPSFNSKSSKQNVISPFTFGSYSSSSTHSSNLSASPAHKYL